MPDNPQHQPTGTAPSRPWIRMVRTPYGEARVAMDVGATAVLVVRPGQVAGLDDALRAAGEWHDR